MKYKDFIKLFLSLLIVLLLTACPPGVEDPVDPSDPGKPTDPGTPVEPVKPSTFSITFDSNGGTEVPVLTVKPGEKIVKPIDPTKNQLQFDNWYKDEQFLDLWDFATDTVIADTTIYAKWNLNLTNTDIVNVTGGTFTQTITNNPGEVLASFNHTLSDYSVGKYEVTYELWYTVYQWAANNGYIFDNPGREGHDGVIGAEPTSGKYQPVTEISWRDSIVWCNAYNEMIGYTPVYYNYLGDIYKTLGNNINICTDYDLVSVDSKSRGFRLLTEGEWQYAASGGNLSNNYIYSGSNNPDDVGWHGYNSWQGVPEKETKTVGLKQPNELGIYDMSGNVYEWCFDWKDNYPVSDVTNYSGPSIMKKFRSIRGGNYGGLKESTGVRVQHYYTPSAHAKTIGFRIAQN